MMNLLGNAKILGLVIEAMTGFANSQDNTEEIQALRQTLAELEVERQNAIAELEAVEREDITRDNAELRDALGGIGAEDGTPRGD